MRVTMQSIYANILTNLNKVNGDMNRINQQISSGKQMSKISDNPVNLINALGLRTNLSEIGQYQKNIQYGNTVINASETAITETKDLVMRAKTLAIQMANAPMTAANRETAAMEVKNLWEQAITLGNSAVNGKHIFGGFRTIGYTPAEPTPFVKGAMDGYFVNGTGPAPQGISGPLNGKGVDNSQNLVPGNLLINGHDVTALHDTPAPLTTDPVGGDPGLEDGDLSINGHGLEVFFTNTATNGRHMENAYALTQAVNQLNADEETGVTASLTTLTASTAFVAQTAGVDDPPHVRYDFLINGYSVPTIDVIDAQSAEDQVDLFVKAINAISDLTGVMAELGDGNNGGVADGIVLKNRNVGDDSAITIDGYSRQELETGTDAALSSTGNFHNISIAEADTNNNTGEVTFTATNSYTITTDDTDDTILNRIGLSSPDTDGQLEMTPAINLKQADTYGLNMASATALHAAFNDPAVLEETGVTALLTTLISSAPPTGDPAGPGTISFGLNGQQISLGISADDVAGGISADDVNIALRDAINAVSDRTGVVAVLGEGDNGGAAGTLVLQNASAGDERDIVIDDFSNTVAGSNFTLDEGTHQAFDGNTGKISLSGANAFTITTSANNDDILALIGLGGGELGYADIPDDGILRYGPSLQEGDLLINGKTVTTTDDGISTIYADASAAAKAAAINGGTFGVKAEITPASILAKGSVQSGVNTPRTIDFSGTGVVEGATYTIAIDGEEFDYLAQADDDLAGIINGLAAAIRDNSDYPAAVANDHRLVIGSGAGTHDIAVTAEKPVMLVNAQIDAQQVADTDPREVDLGTTDVVAGAVYTITIAGESFSYQAQPGDTRNDIADALADAINDSDNYDAANNDDNDIVNITDGAGTLDIKFSVDTSINNIDHVGISNPYPGQLGADDLVINGINIFDEATPVSDNDADNVLVRAINAKSDETGVTASRDQNGKLILSAEDGRNVHIQTSAQGEYVTRLTGATQEGNDLPAPGDQVYFGSVRLWSEQPFKLESNRLEDNDTTYDIGFKALGLTGELAGKDDIRDENLIQVKTIHRDNDYVRYAGDRKNDIAIKVGQHSTIEISKNGFDAIYQSGVFSILKDLEDVLLGDKFRTATSAAQAGDINATLASGETGLALADRIKEEGGAFKVAITDHNQVPPGEKLVTIKVDPENDTLEDIAQRLNGIPGLNAKWDDSGYLQLNSSEDRYSFDLREDTSGLLNATGLEFDNVQVSGLNKSIADLDNLLNELTNQISDFGARANRMDVQTNIYMNLQLATAENLSELEDTDLMEAIMKLKAKEVAYQAALNAAAKTMQLSLVDFL